MQSPTTQTNRLRNMKHEQEEQWRVRPIQPNYDWTSLDEVVRSWVGKQYDWTSLDEVVRNWVTKKV